jgi:hypothetical protein
LLITNNLNGCTIVASVTVAQNIALPTVDATDGFELTCSVENGVLTATATPPQLQILWTTPDGHFLSGATTLTPKVDKKGTYKVVVTRLDNGCSATDSEIVTEETNVPTGISVDLTYPRCDGNIGKIVIASVQGGVGPFLYSINGGNTFFSDGDFDKINLGNYQLLIQDINGCQWSEPLNVPAPLEPTITIAPEIDLELGDSLTLAADISPFPLDLVDSIVWTPTTGLRFKSNSIFDRLHPECKPLENTEYTVTVVSKAGCTATAKIYLKVDKDYHIYIPNVISPWNKDKNNDIFLIFGDLSQIIEITAFEVFDRWGDKVWTNYNFQPNDPAEGWDALVRKQTLNPGVFVYWAKVKFIDGRTILFKGDVTIVR